MSLAKIISYIVLLALGVWFGIGFYTSKRAAEASNAQTNDANATPFVVQPPPPVASNETKSPTGTNSTPVSQGTNLTAANNPSVATNSAPGTNAVVTMPSNSANDTSAVATITAPDAPPANQMITASGPLTGAKRNWGKMMAYFGAFVLVAVVFGLMVAHEISQYFGSRTVDFLFNDKGQGLRDPEYDQAEDAWANGRHLEAIQMMRDYLKKHPRELYVALRIAEIYEKDLQNFLAATLEYEHILKIKFERQRWAWAAIHLVNLYNKTGKTDQAIELLYRIHNEYGDTPAAEKARKRLAQIDPTFNPMSDAIQAAAAADVETSEEIDETPPEAEPPSNLPPGFRPKKR